MNSCSKTSNTPATSRRPAEYSKRTRAEGGKRKMTNQAPATPEETRNNVQAHLLKASKFEIGDDSMARNWSLFFFFRILPQAEFDAMTDRMKSAMNDDRSGAKDELWQDFAQTAFVNAGLVAQRLADDPKSEPDRPAEAFLNWLKAIVSADKSGIIRTADTMLNVSSSASTESQAANPTKVPQKLMLTNVDWADPTKWMQDKFRQGLDVNFLQSLVRIYTRPGDYAAHLQSLSKKVGTAVPEDLLGPLPIVALYEILRQCAPAMMNPAADPAKPSAGIVRGEASERPEGDT